MYPYRSSEGSTAHLPSDRAYCCIHETVLCLTQGTCVSSLEVTNIDVNSVFTGCIIVTRLWAVKRHQGLTVCPCESTACTVTVLVVSSIHTKTSMETWLTGAFIKVHSGLQGSNVYSHKSKSQEHPDMWHHVDMAGIHIHQFPSHSSHENTLDDR